MSSAAWPRFRRRDGGNGGQCLRRSGQVFSAPIRGEPAGSCAAGVRRGFGVFDARDDVPYGREVGDETAEVALDADDLVSIR